MLSFCAPTGEPEPELEVLLGRLTAAIKLLYAPPGAAWVVQVCITILLTAYLPAMCLHPSALPHTCVPTHLFVVTQYNYLLL